ncbi:VOC family protein [Pseudarthrobacter sp. N5]|uniref:VOC family protein n=1 Tax=Pseudarthrobacter sp. N5 TaxID=3418416 RepID=UPI003CE97D68
MDATVAFYLGLGLGLRIDAGPGVPHVAARLPNGRLIEWDSVEFVPQGDSGWTGTTRGHCGARVLRTAREAIDQTYAELTSAGYEGHQQPYDAFWGARYAIVDDPDGNGLGILSPEDRQQNVWPPIQPPQGS